MTDPPEQGGRIKDIRVYRPAFVGMVLLVCAPFLIFAGASLYGAWGTVVLVLVWLVLFGLGCRWFMPRPRRVVVVGLLSLAAWLVVVLLAR
ncbi:hypothetical protein [Nocardioides pocheonensis]|uniref:DUF4175 domain-containing protein n=1 Tax=Nocardioides pocheonensis TaxID=661485 RepID=A0A3N0GNK2_9ACTN|nr:hypothetical protein [Nocardioides pocheonensis]RNM13999.1 hypothetical protein EFL26_13750 [Nocardioides pocheonensis]